MQSKTTIPILIFLGAIMLIPSGLYYAEAGSPNNPDCSGVTPSKDVLWPANGKMNDITINGVTSPTSSEAIISILSITQDERTGKTSDGDGIGTSTAQIRAERSANDDGRVYEISFKAVNEPGESECFGTVTVGVPHDKKSTPVDSGQNFDSTK